MTQKTTTHDWWNGRIYEMGRFKFGWSECLGLHSSMLARLSGLQSMIVCVADDRTSSQPALRILISSMAAFSADTPVWLLYTVADQEFRVWLESYPNVTLTTESMEAASGWNIKPSMLLAALDQDHEEAIWIDSDIVMAGDWRRLIAGLPNDTIVVAEEALWGKHEDGEADRARAWGFSVARNMPTTANTCFVRVTSMHRSLLEKWQELLRDPRYLDAQTIPIPDRPLHLIGDQDVLTALLCTKPYDRIPVKFIRRGADVLQIFGLKAFTTIERLRAMVAGPPPLVHSQQFKPWLMLPPNEFGGIYDKLNAIYLDLSPYTIYARRFASAATQDTIWMKARTRLGKVLRGLGFGYAPLTGLPLAVAFDLLFFMARIRKRLRSFLRSIVAEQDHMRTES